MAWRRWVREKKQKIADQWCRRCAGRWNHGICRRPETLSPFLPRLPRQRRRNEGGRPITDYSMAIWRAWETRFRWKRSKRGHVPESNLALVLWSPQPWPLGRDSNVQPTPRARPHPRRSSPTSSTASRQVGSEAFRPSARQSKRRTFTLAFVSQYPLPPPARSLWPPHFVTPADRHGQWCGRFPSEISSTPPCATSPCTQHRYTQATRPRYAIPSLGRSAR